MYETGWACASVIQQQRLRTKTEPRVDQLTKPLSSCWPKTCSRLCWSKMSGIDAKGKSESTAANGNVTRDLHSTLGRCTIITRQR